MKLAVGIMAVAALLSPQGLELGGNVPEITVSSVDGKKFNPTALSKEGKVVAVVSWSFKCPSGRPCIPRATDVAKKYKGNDKVVFLAVCSYGETPSQLKDYVEENSISYTVCHDEGKKLAKLYRARQVNSSYVLKDGKLFWRAGIKRNGKDQLDAAIKAALAGSAAPQSDSRFAG